MGDFTNILKTLHLRLETIVDLKFFICCLSTLGPTHSIAKK